jgi:hypothetical protein
MAQAEGLRHFNFPIYFQNSKLGGVNRKFSGKYISSGMLGLAKMGPVQGLDRFWRIAPRMVQRKEAGQTRDYSAATSAAVRAARLGPSLGKRRRAQDDIARIQ